jgi:hypothetical protein
MEVSLLGFYVQMSQSCFFISSYLSTHSASTLKEGDPGGEEVLKSRVVHVKRSKYFSYLFQRPRALFSQGLNFFSERIIL